MYLCSSLNKIIFQDNCPNKILAENIFFAHALAYFCMPVCQTFLLNFPRFDKVEKI